MIVVQKPRHLTTTPWVLIAKALLPVILALPVFGLAGCTGGETTQTATSAVSGIEPRQNYFDVSLDEYGLAKPNFFFSTDNPAFWSIQADIGTSISDPDMRCVLRIDIPKPEGGSIPSLNPGKFSLEDNGSYQKFPGSFFVFNGQRSVRKKVESGTISFTLGSSTAGEISGDYDVTMTDYDSKLAAPPQYHLKGSFRFLMGTSNAAGPLPSQAYLQQGRAAYDRSCGSCHSLGGYDTAGKGGSDLSQRGGELPLVFPGAVHEHADISLDQLAFQNLRIFLNYE